MLTTRAGSDSIVISPNLCSIVTGNASAVVDAAAESAVVGAVVASAVCSAVAAPAVAPESAAWSSSPHAASVNANAARIGMVRLMFICCAFSSARPGGESRLGIAGDGEPGVEVGEQLAHHPAGAGSAAEEVLVLVGDHAPVAAGRRLGDAGDRQQAVDASHRLEPGGGDEQHVGRGEHERLGGDLARVDD